MREVEGGDYRCGLGAAPRNACDVGSFPTHRCFYSYRPPARTAEQARVRAAAGAGQHRQGANFSKAKVDTREEVTSTG